MKEKNRFTIIAIVMFLVIAIVGLGGWYFVTKRNVNNNSNGSIALEGVKVEYSSYDLDSSWNETSCVNVYFSGNEITSSDSSKAVVDGNIVTIKSAGEYHLTGDGSDVQVIVEATKDDKVKLILDNVNLKCSNSAPIFVKQADKVIITLADGTTNTITDTANYVLNEDEEPSAAIFSKEDLSINGTGTLTVNANYEDGIVSKDDLKIISGNINVIAKDDAVRGKDSVIIKDGNLNIKSTGDAIKASNEDSNDVGYVVIEGGIIEISAGDDGIHAESSLTINDGKINISKSYEGLEASDITINGGDISVVSSDDGINVAGGNDSSGMSARPGQNNANSSSSGSHMLTINNGYIYVNASGDGLDSNGNIYMNVGTVIVNGPTNNGNGALDYDGTFEVNGGLLIAAGSSGMLQTSSSNSRINCISVTFDQTQQAGSLISLQDSNGNEIVTFAPNKTYQSVIICSADIKTGETYRVYSGGSSSKQENNGLYENGGYSNGSLITELTVNSTVTTYGSNGMKSGGMKGNGMQNSEDMQNERLQKGDMPSYGNVTSGNMPDGSYQMNIPSDDNMRKGNEKGDGIQKGSEVKSR